MKKSKIFVLLFIVGVFLTFLGALFKVESYAGATELLMSGLTLSFGAFVGLVIRKLTTN